MTLPSSGTITMGMISTELKRTGTITLNDADVRKLAGKPSGIISLSDFYGKSSGPTINFIPNSVSPDDGSNIDIALDYKGEYIVTDYSAGGEIFGRWLDVPMESGTSYPVVIKNTSPDNVPFNIINRMGGDIGPFLLNPGQSMSFNASVVYNNSDYVITPTVDFTTRTLTVEINFNGNVSTFYIYG